MTSLPTVLRSFLLGVATGGRSSAGPAAVVWSASSAVAGRDALWLSGRVARVATAVLAAGEAVGDKLPATPSRLAPPGLAFRLVSGGAAGGFLGRRYSASIMTSAVAGAAGALAGSYLGAGWRALAAKRFGPDLPGALIEDATVAGLAVLAVS